MIQKPKHLVFLISLSFLFLIFVFNFFFFQKSDDQKSFLALQERIREEESKLENDFYEVRNILVQTGKINFGSLQSSPNQRPFFLLDSSGSLIYWSDFSFSLDFTQLKLNASYQYLDDPFGSMLLRINKFEIQGEVYYMIQALRLIHPGDISNDYLVTGPDLNFFGNKNFEIFENPKDGNFQIKSKAENPLFGVSFGYGYSAVDGGLNPAILVFFSSIFLLYFLICSDIILKKWRGARRGQAILGIILTLIGFRVFMLWIDFPFNYLSLDLFNSFFYASSWINPSLGDLLINTGCMVVILLPLIFHLVSEDIQEQIFKLRDSINFYQFFIFFFLVSSLCLFAFWYLPRDLTTNSQWAMDISFVSNIGFFKGLSFIILCAWGGFYVLITLSLIHLLWVLEHRKLLFYKVIAIFGFPIFLILLYFSFWASIIWLIHLCFWVSAVRFELFKNITRLGLETFLTFFFTCLITAIIAGISSFQTEKDLLIQSKIRFASQNLIEKDVMTAFFLGEIMARIDNDLFIKSRIEDPFQSKELIETKIRKIYLTNYFDQFDVKVKIFSANSKQLHGLIDKGGLPELRLKYLKSDFATDIKNLYFIPGDETSSGNRFIAFLLIKRGNQSLGLIFLELNQLRVQPTSIYPKLLLDKKYIDKLNPLKYDFSIYKSEELVRSSGTLNYSRSDMVDFMDDTQFTSLGIYFEGYHHLGVENGDELIIVSSPKRSISQFFGNISIYFVIFVLLTFLIIFLMILKKGYQKAELTYATKLQLYLNFAFFFPITVISLITVGLLASNYRQDLESQYMQKANLIGANLRSFLGNSNLEIIGSDLLSEEVNRLASTIASDIHIYGIDGKLISTNRLNIFDKKLLAPLINPKAFAEIVEGNKNELLIEERIGNLTYKSVYLPISSQNNQGNIGILSVPFFESESELNASILVVLRNIFNAFVVIFIFFLFVSYFVSKSLTFPFRLLTQKLKATNLENNEPMFWSSKDEIGLLINEYNNMLFKLETSKKILASTEKESAWREMAKQVAHEIKNPLTPMKLTLQHLLRLDGEGKLNDRSKLQKSLQTIIHQVDALSGIASSFSTFAKMPLPKNEVMDFKAIINQVLELFKNNEQLTLIFKDDSYADKIFILGDDQLFGRIISNLIINGIQSVYSDQKPIIQVWLWKDEEAVFLEISDNGNGIPTELSDKIFLPNFSTKSQGSGLGLSIAKSGVETAGGNIWFESTAGKGSTFFLKFPVI